MGMMGADHHVRGSGWDKVVVFSWNSCCAERGLGQL